MSIYLQNSCKYAISCKYDAERGVNNYLIVWLDDFCDLQYRSVNEYDIIYSFQNKKYIENLWVNGKNEIRFRGIKDKQFKLPDNYYICLSEILDVGDAIPSNYILINNKKELKEVNVKEFKNLLRKKVILNMTITKDDSIRNKPEQNLSLIYRDKTDRSPFIKRLERKRETEREVESLIGLDTRPNFGAREVVDVLLTNNFHKGYTSGLYSVNIKGEDGKDNRKGVETVGWYDKDGGIFWVHFIKSNNYKNCSIAFEFRSYLCLDGEIKTSLEQLQKVLEFRNFKDTHSLQEKSLNSNSQKIYFKAENRVMQKYMAVKPFINQNIVWDINSKTPFMPIHDSLYRQDIFIKLTDFVNKSLQTNEMCKSDFSPTQDYSQYLYSKVCMIAMYLTLFEIDTTKSMCKSDFIYILQDWRKFFKNRLQNEINRGIKEYGERKEDAYKLLQYAKINLENL